MLPKASIRYISISILIYLLLAPSWLLTNIIFPYIGLSKNTGLVFVIANLFVLVLITHRKTFFSRVQKTFIFSYIVLAVYLLLLQLTKYEGSDNSTVGEIFMVLGGIFVLFLLNNPRFDLKYFVRLFIFLSFFFSFLSVILYIDFLLNTKILPSWTDPNFLDGLTTMGGYIAIDDMYGNLYRNQSFWSEAARFAQFLIIPMALSFVRYIKYNKIMDLLIFVTILIAYFLTFSVANFLATLFCGFLFYVVYKDVKTSRYFKHKFIKRILNLIMGGVVFVLLFNFYNITNKQDYGDSIIGKGFNVSAIDRVERFNVAASVIDNDFFGNRSFTKFYARNPTPYGVALIFGGVPYLLLVLANAIIFYFVLIKETRYLKYKYVYLSSLSFFIAFNWYGNFTEAYYLFQIALISTFIKREKEGINFI
jgi:hypothetical protein